MEGRPLGCWSEAEAAVAAVDMLTELIGQKGVGADTKKSQKKGKDGAGGKKQVGG